MQTLHEFTLLLDRYCLAILHGRHMACRPLGICAADHMLCLQQETQCALNGRLVLAANCALLAANEQQLEETASVQAHSMLHGTTDCQTGVTLL